MKKGLSQLEKERLKDIPTDLVVDDVIHDKGGVGIALAILLVMVGWVWHKYREDWRWNKYKRKKKG